MKKRNGEIDILRAAFAIIILIYHCHIIYLKSANYFIRGYLGVEFFFLVSGYYLAKNAKKVVLVWQMLQYVMYLTDFLALFQYI